MDNSKNQLVEKLHSANNILITVSRNPSVDQLAACLGLTLLLNKLDKHATAVFSGEVPSTIEFLQPEQTLEKNTDSLRDFIIALDKTKADKLRYKVEDELVRIFITPYRTSISEKDFEFSQGDFNVELVVALGVGRQEDLDDAITAHGRILHDATVASINVVPEGGLGSINWHDTVASSLCEIVVDLARALAQGLLDEQIATALLTGIVAETQRFSNEKTSAQTMSVSAELMAAGANQQLVATKLEEPAPEPAPVNDDNEAEEPLEEPAEPPEAPKPDDGTLEIEHDDDQEEKDKEKKEDTRDSEASEVSSLAKPQEPNESSDEVSKVLDEATNTPSKLATEPTPPEVKEPRDLPDEAAQDNNEVETEGDNKPEKKAEQEESSQKPGPTEAVHKTSKLVTEPPTLGGRLTANSQPEPLEGTGDPLSLPTVQPLLDRPLPAAGAQPPQFRSPSKTEENPVNTNVYPPISSGFKRPEPIMPGFTPPPPAWVPPSADAFDIASPAAPDNPPTKLQQPSKSASENDNPQNETLPAANLDDARDEVMKALNAAPAPPPPPIQALNARPLGDDLHKSNPVPSASQPAAVAPFFSPMPVTTSPLPPAPPSLPPVVMPPVPEFKPPLATAPLPPVIATPPPAAPAPGVVTPAAQPASVTAEPTAPPPVPPPIPFHFGNTTEPPQQ